MQRIFSSIIQRQCLPFYSFASFSEKLQQREQAKQQEEYKKEIEFLGNKPSYSMLDFRQRIVDGLHKLTKGLKYKFTSGNEATTAQLKQQKQILNAMFDEELLNPNLITGEKKKEIAMVSQVTVAEINQLITNYKSMENLHKWIRSKKENNEPLPESQEEMLYKFREEKPMSKSFLKFEYRKPKYSMKQRMRAIKWGPSKNQ